MSVINALMLSKLIKYTLAAVSVLFGVMLLLNTCLIIGISVPTLPCAKKQIECLFDIHLPAYKEDSVWRRESFTHDISEYQEFQFDSMNQREWMMYLDNIKSRIGDTTMMDITVHKYSKSYPRIDGFNGGYGFSLYKDYEEASLVIDTMLYRGYFEYKSY